MRKRKAFLIVQAALCVLLVALLATGVIGIYAGGVRASASGPSGAVFTREKIGSVLAVAAPAAIALIALSIAFAVANRRGAFGREPARTSRNAFAADAPKRREADRRTALVRTALLAAAVLLIALGIANGGMRDMFRKAILICMECVGIG